MPKPSAHAGPRDFLRGEGGAVLVENVLWIPFVFLLSVALADTFLVYLNHAVSALVLEDATRLLVVGFIPDCDTLETTILAALQPSIPSAVAQCTPGDTQVSVQLTLPAAEMGIGVLSGFVDNFMLPASTIRTLEYFPGT